MAEVTQLLDAAAQGDACAAAELLPLVYEELRKLAAIRMASESAGHSLNATALVHEAYLRLVGDAPDRPWNGRGHFFGAAAEAMRRILVEHARRRQAEKRGGKQQRVSLEVADVGCSDRIEEVLAIDEALAILAQDDAEAAQLVTLRYFGGLSIEEAAEAVGIPRSSAYEHWAYARARLKSLLRPG